LQGTGFLPIVPRMKRLAPVLFVCAAACSSAAGDLRTARDLYRDARYEAAAAWLDALAPEAPAMSTADRATFHYLRGMTEYRLAQYQDALHDLAVAEYVVSTQGSALSPTQRSVLDRTLAELTPDDASPYARSARSTDDTR
jgi:hypothetical protein